MSLFKFTPQAVVDLFDIWSYIAADNPEAADRVETAIYDACELISAEPLIGHVRRELTRLPLRFWTLPRYTNYIIIYDPGTDPLQIIRILHAKRDVKRILEKA